MSQPAAALGMAGRREVTRASGRGWGALAWPRPSGRGRRRARAASPAELLGYLSLVAVLVWLALWMPPPMFYVLPLAPLAIIALWKELPGGTVASLASLAVISLSLGLEPEAGARARMIAEVWPLLPVYLALGPLLGLLAQRDRRRSRLLRRQSKALRRQWRRAEEHARRLRAVSEAGGEIGSSLDLRQTLLLVVEKAAQTLPIHSAAVFQFNSERECYEAVVSHNLSQAEVHNLSFNFDQGVPGWVVRHRRPLLVEDATQDPRVHPEIVAAGIRAVLALPLIAREQVVGVLALYARDDPSPFGEEDWRLAEIFAHQSALAIENVRLLSGWRRTARRLEELVEDRTRALERMQAGMAGHQTQPVEPAGLGRLCVGELCIDPRSHSVTLAGQAVELTPTEFRLLLALIRRAGEAVGFVELAREALDYEPETWEAPDLIKYHVYGLRRKLERDPSNPRHIVNVRGVGYRLPQARSTDLQPLPN